MRSPTPCLLAAILVEQTGARHPSGRRRIRQDPFPAATSTGAEQDLEGGWNLPGNYGASHLRVRSHDDQDIVIGPRQEDGSGKKSTPMSNDDRVGGIIGGRPMAPDERPYLVSIGTQGNIGFTPNGHSCGGTLISPKIVLSAAHCFDSFGFFAPLDWVTFNMQNSADVIQFDICENEYGTDCDLNTLAYAVRHDEYGRSENQFENDLALIFLPEPITDIEPVALNADPSVPTDGEDLEAFGWGLTSFEPRVTPDDPQTATIPYVPNDECQEYWSDHALQNLISSDMLCTLDDTKSICLGDSGGPIVLDTANGTVQVGVSSFLGCEILPSGERNCCLVPDVPNVFSRVSAGMDWINTTACTQIGEWCDECKDLDDEGKNETELDFDVDRLPGFIERLVESGSIDLESKPQKPPIKKGAAAGLSHKGAKKTEGGGGPIASIIGGSGLKENSQPYLVSIGRKDLEGWLSPNGHFCAGTLIDPNAVLSAASCFTGISGNKVKADYVEFSRNDLFTDPGVIRMYLKKSDIWRHPKFNHTTLEYDIALLFLPKPMNEIEPVKLNGVSGIPAAAGDTMEVSGWGSILMGGPPSNIPRIQTVGYLPNEDCEDVEFSIAPSMLCANPVDEEEDGPCDFDWGDPLIKNTTEGPVQIGVFSTGQCRPVPPPPPPPPPSLPPCNSDEKLLKVDVFTDLYPTETHWILTNLCTACVEIEVSPGELYTEGITLYSNEYCVPDVQYNFTLYDTYGDGMPEGSVNVTFDGGVVFASNGDFAFSESTVFGNAAGTCNPEDFCEVDVEPDRPGIYSRVSSGLDWIERTIMCKSEPSPPKPPSSKSSKSSKKLAPTTKSGKIRSKTASPLGKSKTTKRMQMMSHSK